jgi:hypothetical protein
MTKGGKTPVARPAGDAIKIRFCPTQYKPGAHTELLTHEQFGERQGFEYITKSLNEAMASCRLFIMSKPPSEILQDSEIEYSQPKLPKNSRAA